MQPMTALPLPPRAAYTKELMFQLTVEQYHELIRSGALTPSDPVELLEGLLVFKMPKNGPHSTATGKTRRAVEPLLPAGWHYRVQEPITLTDSEPEPDGAVVRGDLDDYAARHPTPAEVALVIEVADSSLDRDRGTKLRSYARAGIRVYWIVNLIDRRVEVYTDPDPIAAEYRSRSVQVIGETVSVEVGGHPVGTPQVGSLLPPSDLASM